MKTNFKNPASQTQAIANFMDRLCMVIGARFFKSLYKEPLPLLNASVMVQSILLALLGGLGGLVAFICLIVVIVKLFKKQKTGWTMPVSGLVGGAIVAVGCGVAAAVVAGSYVFNNRDQIVEAVADEGKSLITSAVEAGSTGVSEGIEGTVTHFEGKFTEQLTKAASQMSVEVISSASGNVEIGIQNSGTEAVKLRDLLENGLLLCVDSGGFDHLFELPEGEPSLLPPASKTRHRLQVKLPDGSTVKAVKLVGHEPVLVP